MGRPALVIEEERLRFFVDNKFKVSEMALFFGVSNRIIERRLQLSTRNYTDISNPELDEAVLAISSSFPRWVLKEFLFREKESENL